MCILKQGAPIKMPPSPSDVIYWKEYCEKVAATSSEMVRTSFVLLAAAVVKEDADQVQGPRAAIFSCIVKFS